MASKVMKKEIKHRLLFCLSLADLTLSTALLLMHFAAPSYLGLPGAVGNNASCSAAGFFFSAASKIGCYINAYLSIYFLMVVRFNWKERDFTRPLELIAHLVPLLVVFGIEIATAVTQSYNPTPLFHNLCLYSSAPWACGDDDAATGVECVRSNKATTDVLMYVLSGPFYMIFSLAGFVCTRWVWLTVRRTLRKSSVYRFESTVQMSSRITSSRSTTPAIPEDPNEERIRQVAIQAVLYSVAYFNSFFWPLFVLVVTSTHEEIEIATSMTMTTWGYVLQVFFWVLFPLQGAINFFVYTRGMVQAWRKAESDASILWIYKQVIITGADNIPRNPRGGKKRNNDSKPSEAICVGESRPFDTKSDDDEPQASEAKNFDGE